MPFSLVSDTCTSKSVASRNRWECLYSKYGMVRGTALAFHYIDVTAAPVDPPEHLGRFDCQP
jgi:hypothetical protein